MLTQQELQGNWKEIKGRVQEKWGQLTDEDLTRAKGSVNQFVGVIQQITGDATEDVERYLDEIMHEGDSVATRATEAAREYTTHAREAIQEQYGQAAEKVQEGYEQAEAHVRQRPVESVAVAFGAGLVAGTLIGLVMRSRA